MKDEHVTRVNLGAAAMFRLQLAAPVPDEDDLIVLQTTPFLPLEHERARMVRRGIGFIRPDIGETGIRHLDAPGQIERINRLVDRQIAVVTHATHDLLEKCATGSRPE